MQAWWSFFQTSVNMHERQSRFHHSSQLFVTISALFYRGARNILFICFGPAQVFARPTVGCNIWCLWLWLVSFCWIMSWPHFCLLYFGFYFVVCSNRPDVFGICGLYSIILYDTLVRFDLMIQGVWLFDFLIGTHWNAPFFLAILWCSWYFLLLSVINVVYVTSIWNVSHAFTCKYILSGLPGLLLVVVSREPC